MTHTGILAFATTGVDDPPFAKIQVPKTETLGKITKSYVILETPFPPMFRVFIMKTSGTQYLRRCADSQLSDM